MGKLFYYKGNSVIVVSDTAQNRIDYKYLTYHGYKLKTK